MAKSKTKKSKHAVKAKRAKKPQVARAASKAAKAAASVPAKRVGPALRRKAPPPSKTIMHRGPRVPEVKHAAVSEKPLSVSEMNKFRDILSQKREDLVTIVSRKKEEEQQIEEAEMGDEADVATRSVEKDIFFELTDSEKQTLDMVEAALRKIDKGIFGRCESCQKPIGRMRLDVMPWARYCIQCKARQEYPLEQPL